MRFGGKRLPELRRSLGARGFRHSLEGREEERRQRDS
jgi:Sec-independent protein translocase protein TatA